MISCVGCVVSNGVVEGEKENVQVYYGWNLNFPSRRFNLRMVIPDWILGQFVFVGIAERVETLR